MGRETRNFITRQAAKVGFGGRAIKDVATNPTKEAARMTVQRTSHYPKISPSWPCSWRSRGKHHKNGPALSAARQKAQQKGLGNEESCLCSRGAGAGPDGYRSGACGLRHREVQKRILPHLRHHRLGTAGRNVSSGLYGAITATIACRPCRSPSTSSDLSSLGTFAGTTDHFSR